MTPLEREIDLLHSRLCAGLADPKRILLLYTLAERPMNVTELTHTLRLPQPTVSRHLEMLRERRLVKAERRGATIFYDIADRRVIAALDILRAVLADQLQRQATLAMSLRDEPST